jgi:hypothetical protein
MTFLNSVLFRFSTLTFALSSSLTDSLKGQHLMGLVRAPNYMFVETISQKMLNTKFGTDNKRWPQRFDADPCADLEPEDGAWIPTVLNWYI